MILRKVVDVNGKEWIDYMASFGPNLLGHKHPEVEAAIAKQRDLGDCLAGPSPRWPQLASARGACALMCVCERV